MLTIGGSDSGGGAGIQADLKTFSVLGLHGTSAVTAITAQNTLGVQQVYGLEPEIVMAQLKSITDDFSVALCQDGHAPLGRDCGCWWPITCERQRFPLSWTR
ncbi:MAG: hydroxymethylpyrimidine/phosphomethylpyrimidine kinase [Desulfobacterales bacterium]|nr:hydroxymethylpyrimidine/phosphomethylpyrimidine kinase [Desulfobacterales bacterium]